MVPEQYRAYDMLFRRLSLYLKQSALQCYMDILAKTSSRAQNLSLIQPFQVFPIFASDLQSRLISAIHLLG